MKQRPRIYYTEDQKALMWDRWQKGETVFPQGDRPFYLLASQAKWGGEAIKSAPEEDTKL